MNGEDTDKGQAGGGIVHGFGSALHWVVGLMEPVRHMVMNVGILAGIALGGPALYKQVTKSSFVIKDISVPPAISGRGLSGDVVAQQIFDRVAVIERESGSKKEKADITGLDANSAMPNINLPVGGLNLAAVVSELRTLFGVTETKVTGEIYVAQPADAAKGTPDLYGMRLRVANQGPIFQSESPTHDVDALIDTAAQRILRRYDPINLGYFYYRHKDFQRATEVTDEVLASNQTENVPWALMMRGLVARQQNHLGEAIADLKLAIAKAPDFMIAHVTLASLLRQNKELDAAEAEARKAIALTPAQHDGYATLAFVLADKAQPDAAMAEMKRSVEAEPKSGPAHFKMGRLQRRLQHREEALASLRLSQSLHPSTGALLEIASLQHEMHQDDEAVATLQEATHLEGNAPRVWLAFGNQLLETKAYGRASRAFQKAISLSPSDPDALIEAAQDLDGHARNADADYLYTHAPPKLIHLPRFLIGWSAHLWAEGRKQDAAAKLREALASEMITAPELKAAADILVTHGDIGAAVEAYKHALVLDPSLLRDVQPLVEKLQAQKADSPPAQPQAQATTAQGTTTQAMPAADAPSPPPSTPPGAAIKSAAQPVPTPQPAAPPPARAKVPPNAAATTTGSTTPPPAHPVPKAPIPRAMTPAGQIPAGQTPTGQTP